MTYEDYANIAESISKAIMDTNNSLQMCSVMTQSDDIRHLERAIKQLKTVRKNLQKVSKH